jgi:hypothetical protein
MHRGTSADKIITMLVEAVSLVENYPTRISVQLVN